MSGTTLPGLPSTAIPTGFAPDGLPIGVQIVGRHDDDWRTTGIARWLQETVAPVAG